jgi:hypothetical protein
VYQYRYDLIYEFALFRRLMGPVAGGTMGVSGPIFAVPDLKWRRAVQSNSHPLLSFFRSLLDLSGIRQCSGCGLRALTCVAIGFVALACAPVAVAQISGFPTECDPPVVDINVDGDLGARRNKGTWYPLVPFSLEDSLLGDRRGNTKRRSPTLTVVDGYAPSTRPIMRQTCS